MILENLRAQDVKRSWRPDQILEGFFLFEVPGCHIFSSDCICLKVSYIVIEGSV